MRRHLTIAMLILLTVAIAAGLLTASSGNAAGTQRSMPSPAVPQAPQAPSGPQTPQTAQPKTGGSGSNGGSTKDKTTPKPTTDPAVIAVLTPSLDFGIDSTQEAMRVANNGGTDAKVSLTTDVPWFAPSVSSVVLAPGARQSVNVELDRKLAPAGPLPAVVNITSGTTQLTVLLSGTNVPPPVISNPSFTQRAIGSGPCPVISAIAAVDIHQTAPVVAAEVTWRLSNGSTATAIMRRTTFDQWTGTVSVGRTNFIEWWVDATDTNGRRTETEHFLDARAVQC